MRSHRTNRKLVLVLAMSALGAAIIGLLVAETAPGAPRAVLLDSTHTAAIGLQNGLPARATRTSTTTQRPVQTALVVPTALVTPLVTSPFRFPTLASTVTLVPTPDCTTVFPITSIEAIRFNTTTTVELEAAFGRADAAGGRPTTYRFEERGCVLRVTVGLQVVMELEASPYGTLDWLLDRYGPPAGVGLSQGNLVLLIPGQAVLLYPAQGLIAIFDALPDDLARTTPVRLLQLRPVYSLDQQFKRLKLVRVEHWVPPLR